MDKSERTEDIGLVEIGPRMVLIPIRIFSGSLGGATLFLNPTFISPNEQRSQAKKYKGYVYLSTYLIPISFPWHYPAYGVTFLIFFSFLFTYQTVTTGIVSRNVLCKRKPALRHSSQQNLLLMN